METTKVPCNVCGTENDSQNAFCGACGAYLASCSDPATVAKELALVEQRERDESKRARATAEAEAALASEAREQAAAEREWLGPVGVRTAGVIVRPPDPVRPVQDGDLLCAQCGSWSPPTRRFCPRCGFSLTDAQSRRRPWWRRLLGARG